MSTATSASRHYLQQSLVRRFTVAEYHLLFEIGVLMEGEPTELLEGYLMQKPPHSITHNSTTDAIAGLLPGLIPPEWFVRCQRAVTLTDSEPEPDIAVVPGATPALRHRTPDANGGPAPHRSLRQFAAHRPSR